MKRLYIIRHAAAERPRNNQVDFKRKLNEKGIQEAKQSAILLANRLSEQPLINPIIISSTAKRAQETAELFCEALAWSRQELILAENIYEAHHLELLKIINDIPEKHTDLILFGHNPGLSDLINYLTIDSINLGTANIACLNLEAGIGFSLASANTAYLEEILFPKNH